ncbi:MAG: L,D-transpeptidase family protein [Clostridia bacterium]|nr:L,D-transpeptidase family protein [Clostridia bacterium]
MPSKRVWPLLFLVAILAVVFVAGVSADKDIPAGPVAAPDEPAAVAENPSPEEPSQNPEEQPSEEAIPVDREPDPSTPEEEQQQPDTVEFTPPQEGYWLEVSIAEQKVRVYQDGAVIKEWLASTGVPEKPTPLGVFEIQNRGEWFFNEKYQQGAQWWVSFRDWGVYLFHTLPMDQNKQIIAAEAEKLGTPASHGCVRLEIENAKWIYDHIPQGTPVYIHN